MRVPRALFAGVILVWAGLAVGGSFLLQRYSATPGARGPVPERWPEATRLPRTSGRPVLAVFAHPECPCTRATLAVLGEISSQLAGSLDVEVVIADEVADPEHADIAARARAIPGVRVVIDHDQAEAHRFGALTSGHTVLYGGDGALRFAGGITDARGQPGASAGSAQITALVLAEQADRAGTERHPERADPRRRSPGEATSARRALAADRRGDSPTSDALAATQTGRPDDAVSPGGAGVAPVFGCGLAAREQVEP
jgi:hypothetical protein